MKVTEHWLLWIFFRCIYLLCMCVRGWEVSRHMWDLKDSLDSFLGRSQEPTWGHQTWQQAPLPTESSCWKWILTFKSQDKILNKHERITHGESFQPSRALFPLSGYPFGSSDPSIPPRLDLVSHPIAGVIQTGGAEDSRACGEKLNLLSVWFDLTGEKSFY